jgi:predicted RNA methylase
MAIVERDIFGSQEIAYECLADLDRTDAFKKAIEEVVHKEEVVLELGTGTGILSLFAAGSGAGHVDAYEVSRPMAAIARQNIKVNKLDTIISVHEADVSTDKIKTDEKYDLLIAEMITVGLIEEQLVPAFNNVLSQNVMKPTAKAIPCANETWCELVETDFNHFGYWLKTVQIEQTWQESKLKSRLTKPHLISHVDFNAALASGVAIDPSVDEVVEFIATQNGTVNALRLTSNSILSDQIDSGWTQCMNSPAIIPIDPIEVTAGQLIKMKISYEMGGEMASFRAKRL